MSNYGLTTNQIISFVTETCGDRPPSHGVEHMKQVRDTALKIRMELPEDQRPSAFDVSLVALLHDVADHKYDHDGSLSIKVRDFLMDNNFKPSTIMHCIECISCSLEQKNGMRWFENSLSPYWLMVRDIVSDADKIRALGKDGAIRCMQYAYEIGQYPLGFAGRMVLSHLVNHVRKRLIHLKDDYIVTAPGKQMAEPLHHELIEYTLLRVDKYLAYK